MVLAVVDIVRRVYNYWDVLAANYIRFIIMNIHIINVIVIIVGIAIIAISPKPQLKPRTFNSPEASRVTIGAWTAGRTKSLPTTTGFMTCDV